MRVLYTIFLVIIFLCSPFVLWYGINTNVSFWIGCACFSEGVMLLLLPVLGVFLLWRKEIKQIHDEK